MLADNIVRSRHPEFTQNWNGDSDKVVKAVVKREHNLTRLERPLCMLANGLLDVDDPVMLLKKP